MAKTWKYPLSINMRMNKENLLCLYSGILFSHLKEQDFVLRDHAGKPRGHTYVKGAIWQGLAAPYKERREAEGGLPKAEADKGMGAELVVQVSVTMWSTLWRSAGYGAC